MLYDVNTSSTKMRKTDRILVLKLKDGTKPVASTGLIDNRLFKGGNRLHAIHDTSIRLWSLKYDEGQLPVQLRHNRWTKFDMLLQDVIVYFDKRNLEIVEVQD